MNRDIASPQAMLKRRSATYNARIYGTNHSDGALVAKRLRGHSEVTARCRRSGFSIVELTVVVLILGVILAIAMSSIATITRNYRIAGDGQGIAGELSLARMRAAADFTHARIYIDLSGNTFHLELWNKANGCWQTDGDANACTQTTSPVIPLAQGDTFGFGSITTGPTAATGAPALPPACTAGVAGPAAGANIANTACIELNSRGYPVDSTNTIVASDAIYLTNNQKVFSAIAVSISGQPTAYSYNGSAWVQF
jgi:prepilin-type N-terminal cleavage/methylation domain-containing protein